MAETITIERLPDESARAYAARVEYVTAGPARSLEKLSQKSTKNIQLFKRWSVQHDWVESARRYDETVYTLAAQEAAEQYKNDLIEFRQRYQRAGKDLYTIAQALIGQMAQYMRGAVIEDKNGKKHTIPAFEMNAATLGQIKGAFQTAADLEALALRVEHLLQDERSSE